MVSSPKPPNPYQQASADQRAQTSAAYGSSIINNPNEVSPYGSVDYSIAGWEQVPDATGKMQYVPRYTRTTSLSPDETRIAGYDTGTRANLGRAGVQQSAKIGEYLNQGIDTSSWQPWQSARGFSESTDRPTIEKSIMESYGRATDPTHRAEEAQLAARGLAPGSTGYGTVQQGREDARSEAARQAYLASGQEARQNYGAYLEGNAANNQLRQAQSQEAFALRNQPINEIMALLGGSQVNLPNFSPFSRQGIGAASPGQYMASNYQNQLQMANARNQGLFGLAGAGLQGVGAAGGMGAFFSDRRLKTGIVPLEGRSFAGLPLYEFAYKDRPELRQVGVMADEVRELYPEAVQVDPRGFDMVDYGLLARRHFNG